MTRRAVRRTRVPQCAHTHACAAPPTTPPTPPLHPPGRQHSPRHDHGRLAPVRRLHRARLRHGAPRHQAAAGRLRRQAGSSNVGGTQGVRQCWGGRPVDGRVDGQGARFEKRVRRSRHGLGCMRMFLKKCAPKTPPDSTPPTWLPAPWSWPSPEPRSRCWTARAGWPPCCTSSAYLPAPSPRAR